jgi:predicted DNA-binding transcriptional regulator AlpA
VRTAAERQPPQGTDRLPDRLLSVADIRLLFGLGRTATYELTHRPDFPEPVVISSRCHRWWASEVTAFAETIRRENPRPRRHRSANYRPHRQITTSSAPACRITGRVRVARPRKAAR